MEAQNNSSIDLSVVVSVYNEEEVLPLFWDKIENVLSGMNIKAEVIFVNDGSTDGTFEVLKKISSVYPRMKVINFSRNFGHEGAMLAGIDYSSGSAVICMDSDLQHPPEKIREMFAEFKEGFDIIHMIRTVSHGKWLPSKIINTCFYSMLNLLSRDDFIANASDFFLISGKVRDVLCKEYREITRFLRGIVQNMGFKRTSIDYEAPVRAGGESKYNLFNLFLLSAGAITCFSKIPLHLGLFIGFILGLVSLGLSVVTVIMKICGNSIPGYTGIFLFLTMMFATQFFLIGLIGEYIGLVLEEIKSRPHYVVESTLNINNR
jgi:dolichol-phosphate mannosyltransferase